jgi:hypothetical protein
MPLGDGTLLRAAIGGALAGVAARAGVAPAAVPVLADAVVQKVAADPQLANALNQEPLRQSGVVWGSSAGFLGSAAVLVLAFAIGPERVPQELLYPALVGALGSLFALIRRIGSFAPLSLFGLWRRKG